MSFRLQAPTRLVLLTALALLALAAPARAAFPGTNGRIAYDDHTDPNQVDASASSIHTVNSDGSLDLPISPAGVYDTDAAWSPDGTKIAFMNRANTSGFPTSIWVMNADGTGRTKLTNDTNDREPVWSPDAKRIAFSSTRDGQREIYVMNADGSNQTRLTNNPDLDLSPAWSPDGKTIAFESGPVGSLDIWTIHPDGTGLTRLTTDSTFGVGLDWSADGSRLVAIHHGFYIAYVSPDGSSIQDKPGFGPPNPNNIAPNQEQAVWSPDGQKLVWDYTPGCEPFGQCGQDYYRVAVGDVQTEQRAPDLKIYATDPSWQPIPYVRYARPRGASPLVTYLVPASKQCIVPTATHGAPLAFPSCSPPQQASSYVTVGTPDANGQGAKSIDSVKFALRPGNATTPRDESIGVSLTDIRNKSDLSDYTGEVQVIGTWRITDQYNGPGGAESGTVVDIPGFPPVTVPCTATADASIGSSCSIATTANATVPGVIKAGKRMILEMSAIQVYDGGSDGLVSSVGNTLFMDQGIFIP